MGVKPLGVATIAGDAQVDHAIAKLVVAFVADPVARWMYDDPHQYLLRIPRLFRTLGGVAHRTRSHRSLTDPVRAFRPVGLHDRGAVICLSQTYWAQRYEQSTFG
jgi:hypothetical protein